MTPACSPRDRHIERRAIAGPGRNPQALTAAARGGDVHAPERPVVTRIAGVVPDRVLAVNPAGDVAADAVEIAKRLWKVRAPAAGRRDLLERRRISIKIRVLVD